WHRIQGADSRGQGGGCYGDTKKLKELGYYKGKINGIYGDDLKKALYAFQKDNNLKVKYTITYEDYLAMGFKEIE
ncbi:MAG TPA: peptidoglycan-binding domain-containing protein, partial [Candidatus Avimonas sp.]|nr:peptidoglycan-binding domain-containing protein [Candidatus Avimonas sp.]